jgi:phage protein D
LKTEEIRMPTPPSSAVKIATEDSRNGSFYAPAFEIRIRGRKLPRDVARDVMQVTYKDIVNEIDSFELTINNWDADARDFKYVGIEGRIGDADARARYLGIFNPGAEAEIWMGYAGNLRLMMSGQITTLAPNFPANGAPTLAVRGLNVLHQLRRKQHTDFWPKDGKSPVYDSDIANEIGQMIDGGEKRFPLTIRINDAARNNAEPPEQYVMQKNEYDIVFLLTRARRHGYVVVVEEFEEKGQRQKRLYFGPSEGKTPGERDVTYVLEWGKSLVQFKPTLTTAKQIDSVTVCGWDRRTKQPIAKPVTRKEIGINADLGEIDSSVIQRQEVITNKPVYSEAQAKAMARDILKDQLRNMVTGSGATVGLPDLRAGRKVFINGLGDWFSGTYFVTETTHTTGDSGYQTTFEARREEEK